MENNKIDVEQISIKINTNIPNNKNIHYITKHIFLDSDTKYAEQKFEDFPFFTNSVKLPKNTLLQKTFEQRIEFFFNRDVFVNTLTTFLDNEDIDNSDFYVAFEEISYYNITTMIELLFTTVYPIINDNKDSFNHLILKKSTQNLSFNGTIPQIVRKFIPSLDVKFSYIKLDGKEYTVTSTCILNDILNHPEYNKLIYKFDKIKKWKVHTKNDIELKLFKIKKNIVFYIDNYFENQTKIKYELYRNTKNFNRLTNNKEQMAIDLNNLFQEFKNSVINDESNLRRILIDIKIRLDDKYLFQTIRPLFHDFITINTIKIKYFDTDFTHKKNYDVVSDDIKLYFQRNYKTLYVLLDDVAKFVSPNHETTNHNLQKMIKDFHLNENNVLEKFMYYVYDKYINYNKTITFPPKYMSIYGFTETNFLHSLYTGINIYDTKNHYNKHRYEAQVSFDLILGKMTNEDISKIACDYKDEQLGFFYNNNKNEYMNKPKYNILKNMLNVNNNDKKNINGGKTKRRRFRKSKKKNTIKRKST